MMNHGYDSTSRQIETAIQHCIETLEENHDDDDIITMIVCPD